jgi:hypothetical protein
MEYAFSFCGMSLALLSSQLEDFKGKGKQMEKEEMVVQLSSQAARDVELFFERSRAPVALSEFLDAYIMNFWEFLRERGYFSKLQQLKVDDTTEHSSYLYYLEAIEDWNRSTRCGLHHCLMG